MVPWLLVLCLSSCEGVSRTIVDLKELQKVQAAVQAAFPAEVVQINLNNGRYLNVALVNSSLRQLPVESRKARAREIAGIAFQGYPARAALESVTVTFKLDASAVVVRYTDTRDTYRFAPADLVAVTPVPTAGAPSGSSQ